MTSTTTPDAASSAPVSRSANSSYLFGGSDDPERRRLDGLTAQFDPITTRHLSRLGVPVGGRCLEVGAGGGSVARWLAGAVGPTGTVVATDIDLTFLAESASDVLQVEQRNVVTNPPDPDSFDLIHARTVLEHIPQRLEVIRHLVTALRPGGVLLVEDLVIGGHLGSALQPGALPEATGQAMTSALTAMAAGFRAVGADPELGARLPGILVDAGLVDVGAELTATLVSSGTTQAAFYDLSLAMAGPRLIAAGVLTEEQVAASLDLIRVPGAKWFSLGLGSAWGRRAG